MYPYWVEWVTRIFFTPTLKYMTSEMPSALLDFSGSISECSLRRQIKKPDLHDSINISMQDSIKKISMR